MCTNGQLMLLVGIMMRTGELLLDILGQHLLVGRGLLLLGSGSGSGDGGLLLLLIELRNGGI